MESGERNVRFCSLCAVRREEGQIFQIAVNDGSGRIARPWYNYLYVCGSESGRERWFDKSARVLKQVGQVVDMTERMTDIGCKRWTAKVVLS